jgi:chromosome partitioning protein
VALYDARSRGTEAYFELAGEFLARNGIKIPHKRGHVAAKNVDLKTLPVVSE